MLPESDLMKHPAGPASVQGGNVAAVVFLAAASGEGQGPIRTGVDYQWTPCEPDEYCVPNGLCPRAWRYRGWGAQRAARRVLVPRSEQE